MQRPPFSQSPAQCNECVADILPSILRPHTSAWCGVESCVTLAARGADTLGASPLESPCNHHRHHALSRHSTCCRKAYHSGWALHQHRRLWVLHVRLFVSLAPERQAHPSSGCKKSMWKTPCAPHQLVRHQYHLMSAGNLNILSSCELTCVLSSPSCSGACCCCCLRKISNSSLSVFCCRCARKGSVDDSELFSCLLFGASGDSVL